METLTLDTERLRAASNALHKILTSLNILKNTIKEKWDPETWLVLHNWIILLSMRNKYSREEWAFVILDWIGEFANILERKEKTTGSLKTDYVSILHQYIEFSDWIFDVHPNNEKSDSHRITEMFREKRNVQILQMGGAFAHILCGTKLEVLETYCEPELHTIAKNALAEATASIASQCKVQNLQFEIAKETTADDIEKALSEYFEAEGFKFMESGANTGTVHNSEGKAIFSTSVSVEWGKKHAVAMITIGEYYVPI